MRRAISPELERCHRSWLWTIRGYLHGRCGLLRVVPDGFIGQALLDVCSGLSLRSARMKDSDATGMQGHRSNGPARFSPRSAHCVARATHIIRASTTKPFGRSPLFLRFF